jgi:hypothetical protein
VSRTPGSKRASSVAAVLLGYCLGGRRVKKRGPVDLAPLDKGYQDGAMTAQTMPTN